MPTVRQSLVATLLHRYPFFSGCGTVANHKITQRLAGPSIEQAWTSVPGGKILVSLGDYVGRAAYYAGELDRKITWICQRLVRPGDTVLDIGANIGLVTLWMSSLVGESGRVHAFEPNPILQEMLEKTFHRNGCSNVQLHRMALGSEEGTLDLWIPQNNAGAGSLILNREVEDCHVVPVPVHTLSSVLGQERIDSVRLIKIDAEGFEEEVLRGALDFLETVRPEAILFEHSEQTEGPVSSQPVISLLRDLEYDFFSIPKFMFRMRLHRFDPDSAEEITGHDLLAAPKGDCYESMATLLRARK